MTRKKPAGPAPEATGGRQFFLAIGLSVLFVSCGPAPTSKPRLQTRPEEKSLVIIETNVPPSSPQADKKFLANLEQVERLRLNLRKGYYDLDRETRNLAINSERALRTFLLNSGPRELLMMSGGNRLAASMTPEQFITLDPEMRQVVGMYDPKWTAKGMQLAKMRHELDSAKLPASAPVFESNNASWAIEHASSGDQSAKSLLAHFLVFGIGVDRDFEESEKADMQLATEGYVGAYESAGFICARQGQLIAAYKWFSLACRSGKWEFAAAEKERLTSDLGLASVAEAQRLVAEFKPVQATAFDFVPMTVKNAAKAAAEQERKEEARRIREQAVALEQKQKAEQDARREQEAAEKNARILAFWAARASNGSDYAQVEMGRRFLNGEGVATNVDSARYWLNKAAAQSNREAVTLLDKLRHSP